MEKKHAIYITSSPIYDQHKMDRSQRTHYFAKDTI